MPRLVEEAPAAIMAPEARADTPPRRLVVMIHGINASQRSWDVLLGLCRRDPRLREFDFETFEYATGLTRWRPTQRLPSLATIASDLGGYLGQLQLANYRDIRLVGHSQGGLVIQRYLHQMLLNGRGRELDRIRQVIFFATPTLGSGIFAGLRRLVFGFISNAQERELRAFNADVGATRRYLDEHVSEATERTAETAQIPIHVFYGQEDNVVDPESAMGSFSSSYAIPGSHSGLINPSDENDRRYSAFADLLLEPVGHRHVFEVERSEYSVRLEPADRATPVLAPLPEGRTRPVTTESVGHYSRRIKFARGNRCVDRFEMRYSTRDDGYIHARVAPPNQWSDQVRRDYEQRGTTFCYQFTPERRRDDGYAMHLKLYRAFERGNRTMHFHLTRAGGTAWARIRYLSFEIDLRPLVAAQWQMLQEPELYLLDVDRKHEECPQKGDEHIAGVLGDRVARRGEQELGVWRWSLTELHRGIVNVLWNVEPPMPATK
jgi:pimeloyl-ACP methyl ester carboxylesterase